MALFCFQCDIVVASSKSNDAKGTIRSAVFRPSLIWDWTKFDVLPVIPVFNIAAAVGVPFVDNTVRVETLADAIVAGSEEEDVEGVRSGLAR